jgi:DNA invertase Pin-like site-specific DNA recombinase
MRPKKYIAYYRVSTNRQGQSGLGLEAQKAAVTQYLNGGDWEILEEFTEVESGKKSNRPKLQEALAACKRLQATLIIAKLDRLARNVHFISGLMEAGVEFVAVDNPTANKLMLHMLAAFAEHEREMISDRTRKALAAAKARGVHLGKNGKKLAKKNQQAADEFARSMRDTIVIIRGEGCSTLQSLCCQLNARRIATATGVVGGWHVATVYKLVQRMKSLQLL